jgi:hypothetical protein
MAMRCPLIRGSRALVSAAVLSGTEAAVGRSDRSVARDGTREVCPAATGFPVRGGRSAIGETSLVIASTAAVITHA